MSSEGYGRHEGGRGGRGGRDRSSSLGTHPRDGSRSSRSSFSSSSSSSFSHQGRRGGPNRKAQQRKRSSEREERITRQTMQSMFFLHSSAAHSFILTRRCTSASSAAVISSTPTFNYHGPDVGVKWDAVRIVKCFAEISGEGAAAAVKSTESDVDLLPVCPICLDSHAAARITKCGHTFCLSCILHHLHSASAASSSSSSSSAALSESANGKALVKCPCCSELVDIDQLRPVHFVTVNKICVLPPASSSNNHKKASNRTVRFVKLHRSRGSFAPFLPQYLSPDGSSLHHSATEERELQGEMEMGTVLKRIGPNAAPSQTDVDSPFCRFNYLDNHSYRRHLMADLTLLRNRSDELRSLGMISSFDSVFLEMATQSVQQELTRQEEWAETEEALRVLYLEESSSMVERVMGRPLPPPIPPVAGKKTLGASSSFLDGTTCARTVWDEDGVKEQEAVTENESDQVEREVLQKEEASSRAFAKEGIRDVQDLAIDSQLDATASIEVAEDHQNFNSKSKNEGSTASAEDGSNENQNLSAVAASEEGATGGSGGGERRGSRRRSGRPRGGSYGSVGSLPVPPASMYLDDDCTQFYQSSDGQLCFLSSFNMNCLAAEFSTHPSRTVDENVGQAKVDDSPSDSNATMYNEEEKAFLASRGRRPLPDYVEGEVMETESVHLTPEVRRRMPFLSHLPLYTNVTFVELNLQRLLSEETKAQFREEFERRKKKRRNRKNSEKQANRTARKAEEERINERKARMQFIDPDDEFFHAIPESTDESVPLNSEEFGPALSSSNDDGTGQRQPQHSQQQQQIPRGQGSWAAGPPPAQSPPSRSNGDLAPDDFFGPPLASSAACGETNPAVVGRGSWALGPPPTRQAVASPPQHTRDTRRLGVAGSDTRGSWAGGPPPQQQPRTIAATLGRNSTTMLSARSPQPPINSAGWASVGSTPTRSNNSDAKWRVVDSSRTTTASVRSISEFTVLGGTTGKQVPLNNRSGKAEKKNKVTRV